jgi:hypothetical protein
MKPVHYFYSGVATEVLTIAERYAGQVALSYDVSGVIQVFKDDDELLNLDNLRQDIIDRGIVPKSTKGYQIHFTCVSKI